MKSNCKINEGLFGWFDIVNTNNKETIQSFRSKKQCSEYISSLFPLLRLNDII